MHKNPKPPDVMQARQEPKEPHSWNPGFLLHSSLSSHVKDLAVVLLTLTITEYYVAS